MLNVMGKIAPTALSGGMLNIRERKPVYYHRDTNRFDHFPISQLELKRLKEDTTGERYRERLSFDEDRNNICLP